jgi:superfamily I DNA/RNA helicase/mRNA-degrading endonuclease RelE of RelBE toxin-antitoxin system
MSSSAITARLGLAPDFLEAFSKLGKQTQAKVRRFMSEFQANPDAPGFNFEKIHAAPEGNLRSVRIDKDYRGIMLKSNQNDAFVFLWVDKHDDAYRWAAGRRVSVHPATGALQVIPVQEQVERQEILSPEPQFQTKIIEEHSGPKLFDPFSQDDLFHLGVPEELITLVRSIHNEKQYITVRRRFPDDVAEALGYLAAGFNYQEVLEAIGIDDIEKQQIDTEDYGTALENPLSRRNIMVVTSDKDLQDVLDFPLEKWRIFLHPLQRKLVEVNSSGAYRVLGAAGTGKTVVAMHRARYLAEHVFLKDEERILFTTFNRNLANDIGSNLDKLCPHAVRQRIDVINIDRWAVRYLEKMKHKVAIIDHHQREELWNDALAHKDPALSLSDVFYQKEWDEIIQYHGIVDLHDYMVVKRIGSGTRLGRLQRKSVWPVFKRYRELLSENHKLEFPDVLRIAREYLVKEKSNASYRAVIIDEAQDMHPEAFKLAKSIVCGTLQETPPNSMYIVGDGHQRIYIKQLKLSSVGIPIIGRSRRLKLNYRTTEETCAYASAILQNIEIDDLDGGIDTMKGYTSLTHGMVPLKIPSKTREVEVKKIIQQIDNWVGIGNDIARFDSICLVARTEKLQKLYQDRLNKNDIPVTIIDKDGEKKEHGLRVATMHRVKGLEFDYIILAAAEKNVLPNPTRIAMVSGSEHEMEAAMKQERCLIYVALTRARKGAMISWVGEKSDLVV